jgi:pilus assembly protein CpaB
MGRRTLLLLASILVAAAGTALIWLYVSNADQRAQEQWGEKVSVLEATSAIDLGAGPDAVHAATRQVQVPRALAPVNPVSDWLHLRGRATQVPILPGQYLQDAQFEAVPSSAGVGTGMVGVAATVEDPNRVAGLLHPNMTVDVYYVADPADDRAKALQGSARLLLRNVRVIAVGNTSVVRNPQGRAAQIGTQSGVAAAIVTLEVHPGDAPKVMVADVRGSLWFTVPGQDEKTPADDAFTGVQLPVGKG